MKKTYIIPSIEIEDMATQEMLAVSLDPTGEKGSVSDTPVESGTPGEGRGGWFDDEE